MGMHWGEVHVSVRALIVLVRFQDITSNCSSGEIGIHVGLREILFLSHFLDLLKFIWKTRKLLISLCITKLYTYE